MLDIVAALITCANICSKDDDDVLRCCLGSTAAAARDSSTSRAVRTYICSRALKNLNCGCTVNLSGDTCFRHDITHMKAVMII